MEYSDKARQARQAYQKEYRARNREKIREINIKYWERKADPEGATVRQLSKQGLTQRAIAERLNISLGTVNKILNT